MRKIFLLLLTITISLSNAFTQETNLQTIIGIWEVEEDEVEEKLRFTFTKEMKYKIGSAGANPKLIDSGSYSIRKLKNGFELSAASKQSLPTIELKTVYFVSFLNANTCKLEILVSNEYGEYAELAASLVMILRRQK
ncbi:MAG: hypothetical protein ACQUHE_14875 [Bacteroidia bacterium]